jgi:hypothetical protein
MNTLNVREIFRHRIKVLLLLLLCGLFACGSNSDKNGSNVTGSSSLTNLSITQNTSSVRITNNGSSAVEFNVVINGKSFYATEDDVINEVRNMSPEYSDEPFYRKLWRYLIINRYHFEPYTEAIWAHSPVLFLNSIGFGFCDDSASLYYTLATQLGYKARLWYLYSSDLTTGHVVAEVWIKDHWEMYDPDMQVYYWNEMGRIAGVEELADNPLLIINPINPFPLEHFSWSAFDSEDPSMPYAYSQQMADIYLRKDSNQIATSPSQQGDVPKYDHPFILPPKAYLEFPVQEDRRLRSIYDTDIPSYGLMRLVLPKDWSGSLKMPFVIISINGSGRISLNNEVYEIGSSAIGNLLNDRSIFIYQTSIVNSLTDIEILFLVNETRFNIDNISSIEIK